MIPIRPSSPIISAIKMHVREDLVEIFATFIQFQAERFSGWQMDPKLRRSMETHLSTQAAIAAPDWWALYWHTLWQKTPESLARGHLIAYLQEPCFWVAQKAAKTLSLMSYGLVDCFQLTIAESDKLLTGYDAKRGMSLKSYARMALPTILRDILRQRREADLCTNWVLLRRLSTKALLDALRNAGLSSEQIDRYRLAWICYRALYTEGLLPRSGAAQPIAADWRRIADLYNRERFSQLAKPDAAVTPETIEQWLNRSAVWARAHLYPPIASLNQPKFTQDAGEVQDDLTDERQSLLMDLIADEEWNQRQQQQAQIGQMIREAIAALDPDTQMLLQLYYQQQMTQQQIAQQLEIPQYTVSRRLTRSREALLKAIVQWSRDVLHISPTPDQIVNLSNVLEEWLRQ